MRRLYWARKVEGLCVTCGANAGTYTRCRDCRSDAVEKMRRCREKAA
jgi:hypothetical protein